MMKKHGLRRFFSLLLAVFMVCTLLPTAALAEDTTGDDETPPKTVAVDEKKTDPPAQEQPKGENPPAQDQPKDGDPPAPEQNDGEKPQDPAKEKIVVDGNTAKNEVAVQELVKAPKENMNKRAAIDMSFGCIGAYFLSGSTGQHTVPTFSKTVYVKRGDAGSNNPSVTVSANFRGSNEAGWTMYIDLVVGNYSETISTNARITNKDMSGAKGSITVSLSYSNVNPQVSAPVTIMGAKDLPKLPTFTLNYEANGGTGAPANQTYKAISQNEKSHEFTISSQEPTSP